MLISQNLYVPVRALAPACVCQHTVSHFMVGWQAMRAWSWDHAAAAVAQRLEVERRAQHLQGHVSGGTSCIWEWSTERS